jgi:hypothetical protein
MITEGILPNSMGEEARDIMQTRMQAMISIKQNMLVAQERMKKVCRQEQNRETLGGW